MLLCSRLLRRALAALVPLGVAGCTPQPLTAPVPPASSKQPFSDAAPHERTETAAPPRQVARSTLDEHVARLLRLAEIWGSVRYEHPFLYELRAPVDWDGALARALPGVNAARSDDEEAQVVQSMLAELHDPLTGVVDPPPVQPSTVVPRSPAITTERGVTILTLGTISSQRQSDELLDREWKTIAEAKHLVVDLRGPQDATTAIGTSATLQHLAPYLVRHECAPPVVRWVQHEGFVPQTLLLAREFTTYLAVQQAPPFTVRPLPHAGSVVFLVDEHLGMLPLVAAMQRAGDARVVASGRTTDAASRFSRTIALSALRAVTVRRAESTSLPPDELVSDPAMARDRAIDLALHGGRAPAAKAPPLPQARAVRDEPYADEALRTLEHRLLAAFRLWNIIRFFYPYPEAENDPGTWTDALADTLPLFEPASTPLAYEQAIALLAARVHDSHTRVDAPHLRDWLGSGILGAQLTDVDGEAVVTRVGQQAERGGLAVGDVVIEMNGEPFATRAEQRGRFFAASNAWTQRRDGLLAASFCTPGTTLTLRVRGAQDEVRSLSLPCTVADPSKRPGVPWRRLEQTIGYVDLGRLEPEQVDPMFAALADTRALVLDMRGYPHGTTIPIAARLNTHLRPVAPDRDSWPVLAPHDEGAEARWIVTSGLLPSPAAPRYAGKTVMLINEQTQSAAEETGLYFEAANGTTFIGSPSAGTNGDITYAMLPGKIVVHLTGSTVAHADGRPLQRVGLQPTVFVRPTLAGIRAGKDEVLDRAVHYLRNGN